MRKKVIIVDFNHIAHTYVYGKAAPLSCSIDVGGGRTEIVNTTVAGHGIKLLNRWAKDGTIPMAVCFDRPCGCRKAYFQQLNRAQGLSPEEGYKSNRAKIKSDMLNQIQLTANYLYNGGVSVYAQTNYEADDLIKACVDNAKKVYPDHHIEIVTGDSDLLGLVEDNVSVFLRSRKRTWSEFKEDEKMHYIEVTPFNYQEVVEDLTAYKNLSVPYNSVVLTKLLRGDKSDNIKGKPEWKPKMYNQLVDILVNYEDISNMFRYDVSEEKYLVKGTGVNVTKENLHLFKPDEVEYVIGSGRVIQRGSGTYEASLTENSELCYAEPQALTNMCNVLGKYVEPSDLSHIRNVYNGLNLNNFFCGFGDLDRKPAIVKDIQPYQIGILQSKVSELRINLI